MNKLIFGTFQNGNSNTFYDLVKAAYENGINTFDTSPSYGTENLLGESIRGLIIEKKIKRGDVVIQDKIDGWQMQETNGKVIKHIKDSILKLGLDYIDVLFIHWPFPDYTIETWRTFAEAKKMGLVKKIGLCNVRKRHIEKLVKVTGIAPEIIQIERHPLRICSEDIQYFIDKGITVQAYSPVCRMDNRLKESSILKDISQKYNKTIGQIILRWHLDTGTIPVFMTNKISRLKENVDLYDFSLSEKDIESINSLDINYKIFVESVCCPGL